VTSDAVQLALDSIAPWVGMSGRAKALEERQAWAAILLPHDALSWAMRYLESKGSAFATSTCALVGCRYCRRLGCTCREHSGPYQPRTGQAVADIQRIAQRHGAWLTSASDLAALPKPGDVLCMRIGNPHISVVTEVRESDRTITCIDGGQKDNTLTARRERQHRADGTVVDLADGYANPVGRVSRLYARASGQRIAETPELCS